MTGFLGWFAIAWAGPGQTRFDVSEGTDPVRFEVGWRDVGDGPQAVSFALPAAALGADREEQTWFPRREFNEAVVAEIRAWARDRKGPAKVTATIEDGGIRIGVSGGGDPREVLEAAERVRDAAMDRWLAANAFFKMEDGGLSYDHAKLVTQYADDLAPVAAALRAGTTSDRDFVARALAFVQAIPYEARKQNGGDPGYRRPLALLWRNRGDCDSKAVLFLGILRAELPALPTAVVYVPGHALTGVGLPPGPNDQTFEAEGVTYVYAEPVGPAQLPVGTPAPDDEKAAKKGQVRAVPR